MATESYVEHVVIPGQLQLDAWEEEMYAVEEMMILIVVKIKHQFGKHIMLLFA